MAMVTGVQSALVIGGGIVGVCAAYELARRGVAVTLLERDDFTRSASIGNAGHIAPGHGPLPKPGLALQTIKWMFNGASPLYIPPRLDPDLVRWLWEFRRACSPAHYDRSTRLLAEHGFAAAECFANLVREESIDCEYRPHGRMEIYRTDEGIKRGEREVRTANEHGYRAEMIDAPELQKREPALLNDVRGAAVYDDHASADPGAFLRGMAEHAQLRGVVIRRNSAVARMLAEGDRCLGALTTDGERFTADAVVLAAGIWTTQLAAQVGVRVPMQAGKGYHVMLSAPEPCLRTASVLAETFIAVTPLAGQLRLAGTLEFSGVNHRMVRKRLEALRIGAMKYLRGIESTVVQSEWCGLRPCTADGLPVVGWSPALKNLFIATGHAMMGFALGPLTGRLAAECIVDGESSLDLTLLSPARFAR